MTPVKLSLSSLILLFYLILLSYILSDSLLCSVPDMCNLSNPHDLHSQNYPIPTGTMGSWIKVPDHYSSIPNEAPWQRPLDYTGSGPTQDSTISQLTREKRMQPISTNYTTNPSTPKITEQSKVFQDLVRIFNPG